MRLHYSHWHNELNLFYILFEDFFIKRIHNFISKLISLIERNSYIVSVVVYIKAICILLTNLILDEFGGALVKLGLVEGLEFWFVVLDDELVLI